MSQSLPIPVTCPSCGNTQDFQTWQSINVTLDTQLKRQLLDGSLNRFTCAKCSTTAEIVYPLLYHDMDKKLLFWLVPEGQDGSELQPGGMPSIESLGQDGLGYILRRVGSRNALVEKVFIADYGLDDRAIECMKLILLTQMPPERQRPGMQFWFTRAGMEEGQDRIEFTVLTQTDPPQGLGVPREPIYAGCLDSFVAGKAQPSGWASVDAEYATQLISEAEGRAPGSN